MISFYLHHEVHLIVNSKNYIVFLLVGLVSMGCASHSHGTYMQRNISGADSNIHLGFNYLEQQNVAMAKRKFIKAVEDAPNYAPAWYSIAYFWEATGNLKLADRDYRKAININSQLSATHNNYGTFLCRHGRYEEAVREFVQAAKNQQNLNSASAYTNAGLCAEKIPNYNLARSYFHQAVMLDPKQTIAKERLANM